MRDYRGRWGDDEERQWRKGGNEGAGGFADNLLEMSAVRTGRYLAFGRHLRKSREWLFWRKKQVKNMNLHQTSSPVFVSSVPVETSTSTALVSCDGLGGYD
ncbi:hypothetical protein Tco_0179553 [Tanacetum coccineum]